MNNVLVFHVDGSVEETVHEGVKNLWPRGTIFIRYYGDTGYSIPQIKLNACQWKSCSSAYITPSHRAFLLLMGLPQPKYDYIGEYPYASVQSALVGAG